MPDFKTIKAWQKADDLTVEVYEKTRDFPSDERFGLTSQMRRAAVSVGANIAEGSGRGSLADYIRFLFIAQGSLSELEYESISLIASAISQKKTLTSYQLVSPKLRDGYMDSSVPNNANKPLNSRALGIIQSQGKANQSRRLLRRDRYR